MVPGMSFLGVLGMTFAARNCCLPVFARSPNTRTCVSFPSRLIAAACMSSGTGGGAGLAGSSAADLGAGSLSQPVAIIRAQVRANVSVRAAGSDVFAKPRTIFSDWFISDLPGGVLPLYARLAILLRRAQQLPAGWNVLRLLVTLAILMILTVASLSWKCPQICRSLSCSGLI